MHGDFATCVAINVHNLQLCVDLFVGCNSAPAPA